jgi:hypothetical protein
MINAYRMYSNFLKGTHHLTDLCMDNIKTNLKIDCESVDSINVGHDKDL